MITTIEKPELRARDGSTLAIRESDLGELLSVSDPAGRILFTYDSSTGCGAVHIGGLEIRSSERRVELACDRELSLSSPEAIALRGGESCLKLAREKSELRSRWLEARIGETELQGERIAARVQEAEISASRMEVAVGRVVRWARSVYERVEDLFLTMAGRIRTESEGAYLVRAERARFDVEEEVKVHGKTIHLG